VIKDCVTCLAPTHDNNGVVERTLALRRNCFGAALPTHWVAGTVEGSLVGIHASPVSGAGEERGGGTRQDTSSSHLTSSAPLMFVADHARPLATGSAREKKKYGPLHKEPVTAIAVSAQNDVVSTDLAQNVVISTFPPLCRLLLQPVIHLAVALEGRKSRTVIPTA